MYYLPLYLSIYPSIHLSIHLSNIYLSVSRRFSCFLFRYCRCSLPPPPSSERIRKREHIILRSIFYSYLRTHLRCGWGWVPGTELLLTITITMCRVVTLPLFCWYSYRQRLAFARAPRHHAPVRPPLPLPSLCCPATEPGGRGGRRAGAKRPLARLSAIARGSAGQPKDANRVSEERRGEEMGGEGGEEEEGEGGRPARYMRS